MIKIYNKHQTIHIHESLFDRRYFTDQTIAHKCFLVVLCKLLAIISNDYVAMFMRLRHFSVGIILCSTVTSTRQRQT